MSSLQKHQAVKIFPFSQHLISKQVSFWTTAWKGNMHSMSLLYLCIMMAAPCKALKLHFSPLQTANMQRGPSQHHYSWNSHHSTQHSTSLSHQKAASCLLWVHPSGADDSKLVCLHWLAVDCCTPAGDAARSSSPGCRRVRIVSCFTRMAAGSSSCARPWMCKRNCLGYKLLLALLLCSQVNSLESIVFNMPCSICLVQYALFNMPCSAIPNLVWR